MIRFTPINVENVDDLPQTHNEVPELIDESVNRYNQALRLYNKGRRKDARELLEQILEADWLRASVHGSGAVPNGKPVPSKPSQSGLIFRDEDEARIEQLLYNVFRNYASFLCDEARVAEHDTPLPLDDHARSLLPTREQESESTVQRNRALDYLLRAAELDASDTTLWLRIGRLALETHQLGLARAALERVINSAKSGSVDDGDDYTATFTPPNFARFEPTQWWAYQALLGLLYITGDFATLEASEAACRTYLDPPLYITPELPPAHAFRLPPVPPTVFSIARAAAAVPPVTPSTTPPVTAYELVTPTWTALGQLLLTVYRDRAAGDPDEVCAPITITLCTAQSNGDPRMEIDTAKPTPDDPQSPSDSTHHLPGLPPLPTLPRGPRTSLMPILTRPRPGLKRKMSDSALSDLALSTASIEPQSQEAQPRLRTRNSMTRSQPTSPTLGTAPLPKNLVPSLKNRRVSDDGTGVPVRVPLQRASSMGPASTSLTRATSRQSPVAGETPESPRTAAYPKMSRRSGSTMPIEATSGRTAAATTIAAKNWDGALDGALATLFRWFGWWDLAEAGASHGSDRDHPAASHVASDQLADLDRTAERILRVWSKAPVSIQTAQRQYIQYGRPATPLGRRLLAWLRLCLDADSSKPLQSPAQVDLVTTLTQELAELMPAEGLTSDAPIDDGELPAFLAVCNATQADPSTYLRHFVMRFFLPDPFWRRWVAGEDLDGGSGERLAETPVASWLTTRWAPDFGQVLGEAFEICHMDLFWLIRAYVANEIVEAPSHLAHPGDLALVGALLGTCEFLLDGLLSMAADTATTSGPENKAGSRSTSATVDSAEEEAATETMAATLGRLIVQLDMALGAKCSPALAVNLDAMDSDGAGSQQQCLVYRRHWLGLKVGVLDGQLGATLAAARSLAASEVVGVTLPNCRFLPTLGQTVARRLADHLATEQRLRDGLADFTAGHYEQAIRQLRPAVAADAQGFPLTMTPGCTPRFRAEGAAADSTSAVTAQATSTGASLDPYRRLVVWQTLQRAYQRKSPPNAAEAWACQLAGLVAQMDGLSTAVTALATEIDQGLPDLTFPSARSGKAGADASVRPKPGALAVAALFAGLTAINTTIRDLTTGAQAILAQRAPRLDEDAVETEGCGAGLDSSRPVPAWLRHLRTVSRSTHSNPPKSSSSSFPPPPDALLLVARLSQHIIAYDGHLQSLPEEEIQVPLYTLMVRSWELLAVVRLMQEAPPARPSYTLPPNPPHIVAQPLPIDGGADEAVDPLSDHVAHRRQRIHIGTLPLDACALDAAWRTAPPVMTAVGALRAYLRTLHHTVGQMGLCTVDKGSFLALAFEVIHWDDATPPPPLETHHDALQCLYCLYNVRLDGDLEEHDCEPLELDIPAASYLFDQLLPRIAERLFRPQAHVGAEWRSNLEAIVKAIGDPHRELGRVTLNERDIEEYLDRPVDLLTALSDDPAVLRAGGYAYLLPALDCGPTLAPVYFHAYLLQGYALHTQLRQRIRSNATRDPDDLDTVIDLYRNQLSVTPTAPVAWYCLANVCRDEVAEKLMRRANALLKATDDIVENCRLIFLAYLQCYRRSRNASAAGPMAGPGSYIPPLHRPALLNEMGQFLYFLTRPPVELRVCLPKVGDKTLATNGSLVSTPSAINGTVEQSGEEAEVQRQQKQRQWLVRARALHTQPPTMPSKAQVYRLAAKFFTRALEGYERSETEDATSVPTPRATILNQLHQYPPWTADLYLGRCLRKLESTPLRAYACLWRSLQRAIASAGPGDSSSGVDALIEPMYTLLSSLAKDLHRGRVPVDVVDSVLDQLDRLVEVDGGEPRALRRYASRLAQIQTVRVSKDRSRPNRAPTDSEGADTGALPQDPAGRAAFDRILDYLELIRVAIDGRRWHHKPVYRTAWIRARVLCQYSLALDALAPLFNARSVTKSFISFYKTEMEPPGQHYYYVHKYLRLLLDLYERTGDLDGLFMVAHRLRKLDTVLIAPRVIAAELYVHYRRALEAAVAQLPANAALGVPDGDGESTPTMASLVHVLCLERFERLVADLEQWLITVLTSTADQFPASGNGTPAVPSMPESSGGSPVNSSSGEYNLSGGGGTSVAGTASDRPSGPYLPSERSYRLLPASGDLVIRRLYQLFALLVHAVKLKRLTTTDGEQKQAVETLVQRIYVDILVTFTTWRRDHPPQQPVQERGSDEATGVKSSPVQVEPAPSDVVAPTEATSMDEDPTPAVQANETTKEAKPSPSTPQPSPPATTHDQVVADAEAKPVVSDSTTSAGTMLNPEPSAPIEPALESNSRVTPPTPLEIYPCQCPALSSTETSTADKALPSVLRKSAPKTHLKLLTRSDLFSRLNALYLLLQPKVTITTVEGN
ncbi:Histone transcription regulator 3 [Tieghemiomyces parasiticus]|uniref:Histone transcription regulator 3 n=1 Tax=Tieghemiomyces parasiticus TaxID=78921 RepID=A0A9W8A4H2_9FUNG|nr:Histone transcription regulator 3 [Tieghemiomyces parasiticus]